VLYPPTILPVDISKGLLKVVLPAKFVVASALKSPLPTYTPFYKSVSSESPELNALVLTINFNIV